MRYTFRMSGRYEIESRREQIAKLCREHKVAKLMVFGSAMRDDFHPDRIYIDLLVEFLPGASKPWAGEYFELQENLRLLFAREIDLVSLTAIRNPYVAAAISQDQELLYAA